jgi:hypothetical protein
MNTNNGNLTLSAQRVVAGVPQMREDCERSRSSATSSEHDRADAVHPARPQKRGLEGGHGSPSECEYFIPDETVEVGGREFHGCGYDASPGNCPFNGDLACCGERE